MAGHTPIVHESTRTHAHTLINPQDLVRLFKGPEAEVIAAALAAAGTAAAFRKALETPNTADAGDPECGREPGQAARPAAEAPSAAEQMLVCALECAGA